jgi:hypothetical protein
MHRFGEFPKRRYRKSWTISEARASTVTTFSKAYALRPHRLARSRTPAFHAGNTGSNPVGDANNFRELRLIRWLPFVFGVTRPEPDGRGRARRRVSIKYHRRSAFAIAHCHRPGFGYLVARDRKRLSGLYAFLSRSMLALAINILSVSDGL